MSGGTPNRSGLEYLSDACYRVLPGLVYSTFTTFLSYACLPWYFPVPMNLLATPNRYSRQNCSLAFLVSAACMTCDQIKSCSSVTKAALTAFIVTAVDDLTRGNSR